MGLDGAQHLHVDEGAATVAGGAGAEESVEDGHGLPFAGLAEFTGAIWLLGATTV